MQMRYQAALRPEGWNYNRGAAVPRLTAQKLNDAFDFLAHGRELSRARRARCLRRLRDELIEAIACTADRETLIVKKLADTPDQQNFVVLVVATIASSFHRLELRELLFPVTQDVRLDAAQLAHFADGEVPLRGYRRQRRLSVAVGRFHRHSAPRPSLSASGRRGK